MNPYEAMLIGFMGFLVVSLTSLTPTILPQAGQVSVGLHQTNRPSQGLQAVLPLCVSEAFPFHSAARVRDSLQPKLGQAY